MKKNKILLLLLSLIVAVIFPNFWGFSPEITTVSIATEIMATDSMSYPVASNDLTTNDNPRSLLIAGIEAYETENFIVAIDRWQAANKIFIDRGDFISQALTHSYLSLAYQKLGSWQEAEAALKQAKELIKSLDRDSLYLEVETKIYSSQASFDWRRGKLESALSNWDIVINNYQKLGDLFGEINAKINRAQVLQFLGFTVNAREELEAIHSILQVRSTGKTTEELKQKAIGLRLLGSVYRSLGMLQESSLSLQQGWEITQQIASNSEQGKFLLELGNTERYFGDKYLAVGKIQEAIKHYTLAIDWYDRSSRLLITIEPEINILSLSIELGKLEKLEKLETTIKNIEAKIEKLPDNRQSLTAELNFARSLICLRQISDLEDNSCVNIEFRDRIKVINDLKSWQGIASLVAIVRQKSHQIEDRYLETHATIQLGHLYEIDRQWQAAEKLTKEALVIAEELQFPELSYRGEWQLGRLRQKQADPEGAISAYSSAVKHLRSVGQNLASIGNNTQFSFQDNVEPLYYNLVDLLLQNGDDPNNLKRAIETIDSFKLAELENFLGCKLNLSTRLDNNLEKVDPQAVLIYPIILADRLEVIYRFPQQNIAHFSTYIGERTVKETIEDLRVALVRRDVSSIKEKSHLLYQWILEPLDEQLKNNTPIENLVFIADSYLQTIPFSVLYDRNSQEYLLQKKYNIVNLPSINIFQVKDTEGELNVLAGGISQKIQVRDRTFSEIDTDRELEKIASKINAKILLNSEFTETNLAANMQQNNYSIVHLATHGYFSSDPEETFLIVHSPQEDRGELLKAKNLDNIVRSHNINGAKKIELLVLSACQTALGDRRATLGLSGMTIAAGANSSIGTLWQVNDASVILFMEYFYQELAKPDISKAEAVRKAQKILFADPKYQNPYYWSPFVLVGNWL